jgi:hypothetical protein
MRTVVIAFDTRWGVQPYIATVSHTAAGGASPSPARPAAAARPVSTAARSGGAQLRRVVVS